MIGILIFSNRAPIIRHSKQQNRVETLTFGSEFTAMKKAVELITALRYKLRMFGVPIDRSIYMFCDNEVVYKAPEETPQYRLPHEQRVPREWRLSNIQGRHRDQLGGTFH